MVLSASEMVFLTVGGVGLVMLILSFVLGEIPFVEHAWEGLFSHGAEVSVEADAGDNALSDVPAWYGMKSILAAMVGFGSVGFCLSYYGSPAILTWPPAAFGGFLMIVIVYHGFIKPLARQQHNSLLSRQSYVGTLGRIVLSIPADGFGEVEFRDANGATVRQKAETTEGEVIERDTMVLITDITLTGVIVEPVSIV